MKIEHKAWLGRYRVTLSIDMSALHDGMHCVWEPQSPEPASLTRREQRRYLNARREFLSEVSKAIGGLVMAVDQ